MSNKYILSSERLRFRELTKNDLPFIDNLISDNRVMNYMPQRHTTDGPEVWLNRQLDRYEKFGFGPWLCESKTDGQAVGQIGLSNQSINGRDEIEVGCFLLSKHWGLGYATEAAKACLDYGFQNLDAKTIFALIREINLPSIAVATRLGMRPVGLSDHAGLPHQVYTIDIPK